MQKLLYLHDNSVNPVLILMPEYYPYSSETLCVTGVTKCVFFERWEAASWLILGVLQEHHLQVSAWKVSVKGVAIAKKLNYSNQFLVEIV